MKIVKPSIAIFGNMGSGKTTVAKYLCDNYGYSRYSLGKKIHDECELYGMADREHFQGYGQKMREIFNQNIWNDYLYEQVKDKNNIVIDDCRQNNEFAYWLFKEYLPIGIVTDENIRLERLKKRVNYEIDLKTLQHDTEIQASQCIERCDIKIDNNGDYGDLVYEIENKLGKYLRGGM